MRPSPLAAVALLLGVAAVPVGPAGAQVVVPDPDPYAAALERALGYLENHAATGNEYLVEAVIGAGLDPGLWPSAAASVLDRLAVPAVGAFNDPIREIHAVAQSGYDPFHFQGRDLVADLKAAWAQSNQGVGQAAFTLLGLHAAGVARGDPTLEETLLLLQRSQFASGGWSCWGLPSPDCTGFALTALAAEGAFLPGSAERARVWLDANRLANGGYASGGHIGSLTVAGVPLLDTEGGNTQSTIWAIHGYRAIGDPAPAASMAYLLSRQMPDGGFAWRDADVKSDPWSTMEVVAGWKRSFHSLAEYVDADVAVPDTSSIGVPTPLRVDGFTHVVWRDLGNAATAILGTPAEITFPSLGTSRLHVDASRDGAHHRERIETAVQNAAPAFAGLPSAITVPRGAPIGLEPQATDPDGHAVAIRWEFRGQSGTGAVTAVPDRVGDFVLGLSAEDPYGGLAEASVVVHVVKRTRA